MKFFEDENIKYYLFPCDMHSNPAVLCCSVSKDSGEFGAEAVGNCWSIDDFCSVDDISKPDEWTSDPDDLRSICCSDPEWPRSGMRDLFWADLGEYNPVAAVYCVCEFEIVKNISDQGIEYFRSIYQCCGFDALHARCYAGLHAYEDADERTFFDCRPEALQYISSLPKPYTYIDLIDKRLTISGFALLEIEDCSCSAGKNHSLESIFDAADAVGNCDYYVDDSLFFVDSRYDPYNFSGRWYAFVDDFYDNWDDGVVSYSLARQLLYIYHSAGRGDVDCLEIDDSASGPFCLGGID